MAPTPLSRRLFLGSTAAVAAAPLSAFGQELSPSQTAGVEVPPGRVREAVGRLDGIAAGIMQRSGIPGLAIAVVQGDKTLYAKGFGVRHMGAPEPITPETVFQIASLSKSVGATVVASQVSKGIVSWDSRMKDLLPWFTLSDPARSEKLTIGDLYSHRSGLPDHAGDDLEDLGYGRQAILEKLSLLPLAPFRISYAYTNAGLTAAAEGVARAAGTDWASLSEEAIYRPLGMTHTSSRFDDFMAQENRATQHAFTGNGFAPLYQRQPDAQAPAGGVSSSLTDMTKWLKMLVADGAYPGGTVLKPEALLPALSPQSFSGRPAVPDARAGFYGYGFNVGTEPSGRVRISHSGAFLMGTGTCFSYLPSMNLAIIVLSNAGPVGAVEAIASSFTDLAQLGHETRDWFAGYSRRLAHFNDLRGETVGKTAPANPAPPPPADACIGTYEQAYFGRIDIRQGPEGLILAAGPDPMLFPLSPWDGPVMVFDFTTENAPAGSRSTLRFGDLVDGRVQSLEVELFSEAGPAVFERM